MDFVLALVAVVLALGVGIAVAWPLLRQRGADDDSTPADRRERLEDQLEASLRAIREIELDHLSGGLSDEDFETLNRDERTRAVALMRRIDALGDAGAAAEASALEAESAAVGVDPSRDAEAESRGAGGALEGPADASADEPHDSPGEGG